MKYILKILLTLSLLNIFVFASLDNETYIKAKEYYIQDNYSKALEELSKYIYEDNEFLSDNSEIKEKIMKVIEYCKQQTQEAAGRLILKGAIIKETKKPELP